jgi:hypothetical protein
VKSSQSFNTPTQNYKSQEKEGANLAKNVADDLMKSEKLQKLQYSTSKL